jgi:hypothetical protein
VELHDDAAFVMKLKQIAQRTCGQNADMGAMEMALEEAALSYQRAALEQLVQERANQAEPTCACSHSLRIESHDRARTVLSRFGDVRFTRLYGYCKHCNRWHYPSDRLLGLQARARSSPRVQEICALQAVRAPAVHAKHDTHRLTHIDLDPRTIHREALRQGQRAIALREADVALTQSVKGLATLAARAPAAAAGSTLVIEMDAWLIRERDQWGLTKRLREAGEPITRWHWVYTATIFRLDQRASLESGRAVITERKYLATRLGLDAFRQQLYAQALQCGASQAREILVLGDGAAWIWNIAEDRFRSAAQRVDFYHVSQHLWAIANDLYPHDSQAAREWVHPYQSWLKNRKKGADDLVHSLTDLLKDKDNLTAAQRENLQRELGYFEKHQKRMNYKQARTSGQPMGSGAIESTCSQYQSRFKLRGQFWSLGGDEALLALWSLHRNQEWHRLFPHDRLVRRPAA